MNEMFSNIEDCCSLAKYLKRQLGDQINFWGSIHVPVPSGKYLSTYRSNYEFFSHNSHCLPFYFKFVKNGFLRIGVGSHSIDNSFGEKLAVLSDFYEVLREEYDEPTIFYTTKDDDEGYLTLQWCFDNKDEEIAKFQNGIYFDDAEIDTLIVFGQRKDNVDDHGLNDTTKKFISKGIGLPFELLSLADEDIENFIKHKKGSVMAIPNVSKETIEKSYIEREQWLKRYKEGEQRLIRKL